MSAPTLLPLPPVPGVTDAELELGGRSMLDLLTEDHHLLDQLCARLADRPTDQLRDVLTATLCRHISAERQYLCPTIRAVLPDGAPLADRELTAHAETLTALRTLRTAPAALADITARVREHTHRTEELLFPGLRHGCTPNELIRLGNRVEIARGAAPTRPHPATPAVPPLNKLVDPAVGVVDKVLDALSWRTTWAADL